MLNESSLNVCSALHVTLHISTQISCDCLHVSKLNSKHFLFSHVSKIMKYRHDINENTEMRCRHDINERTKMSNYKD